eukprot:PhF_6_TR7041/c0_g1_i2/m.10576
MSSHETNGPKVFFHIEGFPQPYKFKLSNNCPLSFLFARLPPHSGYFLFGNIILDPSLTPESYGMNPGENNAITLTFMQVAQEQQPPPPVSTPPPHNVLTTVASPVPPPQPSIPPTIVLHGPVEQMERRQVELETEVKALTEERKALQGRVSYLSNEVSTWRVHAEENGSRCESMSRQLNAAIAELEEREKETKVLTHRSYEMQLEMEHLRRDLTQIQNRSSVVASSPPPRLTANTNNTNTNNTSVFTPPSVGAGAAASGYFENVTMQDILHRLDALELRKTPPATSAATPIIIQTAPERVGVGVVTSPRGPPPVPTEEYEALILEAHKRIVELQSENDNLRSELRHMQEVRAGDMALETIMARATAAEAEVVRLRNVLATQTPTIAQLRSDLYAARLEIEEIRRPPALPITTGVTTKHHNMLSHRPITPPPSSHHLSASIGLQPIHSSSLNTSSSGRHVGGVVVAAPPPPQPSTYVPRQQSPIRSTIPRRSKEPNTLAATG